MTNIVTYPTNPVQGQEFTVGETIKVWDGEKWENKTPTNNPHNVTKAQVGLGNVDDVSATDLRDRSTHTGTQTLSTLSDAGSAASKDVGTANGVASLDGSGKVPDSESQVSSVSGKKGDVELNLSDIKVNGGTADNVVKAQLIAQGLSGNYGFFEEGFNYSVEGDIGIDADGNSWIYVGAGAPNKVVAAGTVPSVATGYEQVTFNSLQQLIGLDQPSVLDKVYSRKVPSIKDLISVNPSDMDELNVISYHAGWAAVNHNPRGGGKFIWDASRVKADHDGGHVIDPDRPFPVDWTNEAQKENWFTASSTGNGCFVRVGSHKKHSSEYGQVGDNNIDDSKAIKKMLLSSSGGKAVIDKQVSGTVRAHFLEVQSDTKLSFEPSTIIRTPLSHPSNAATRTLIVNYADRVSIYGNNARLEMDAVTYTGEAAHGLQIYESEKVEVSDLYIYGSKGDGVYLGGVDKASKRVKLTGITCDGQRRNGLSIVHAQHCYVSDSVFINSNGINPQFGVDIEPNDGYDQRNITIERCEAYGNVGAGFSVISETLNATLRDCVSYDNQAPGYSVDALSSNTKRPKNVSLINCTSYGNSYSFYSQGADSLTLENFKGYDAELFGMQILDYTDLKVSGGGIYRSTLRGVLLQGTTGEARFSNGFTVKDCKDTGFYSAVSNLTVDGCVFEGNANSETPTAKANVHIFNGSDVRLINNKIRKGSNAYKPDDGILLRNTGTVSVYLQGNDLKTAGEVNGVNEGVLPAVINAGNINNDGTYSDVAS